jgi:dTDP-4-dehydrorhamnose 3,5-epimerase
MIVRATRLPGVLVIEPTVYQDERGFFLETFHHDRYREAGIATTFVQDNHSSSVRGTLRGLHLQRTRQQAKLVRALRGSVIDVAVDVRVGSPSFGQWVAETLSEDNFRQMFIPAGFAHGFCVLSDRADVAYKCSDYYAADDEMAVAWNDPAIGIDWPIEEPILSERDRRAPRLEDLHDRLPRHEP